MNEPQENVLPLSKKEILPQDKLDRGLFLLMTVGVPAVAVWETVILFRYHSDLDLFSCSLIVFEIILLMNVLGNLFYLKRVDSSGKHKKLPSVLRPNWSYCHFCQMNSPPRAYHCPICDECILKRDQHCMFAGCCVGFYNHRYYLMSVIYIMIGSLCAAIFQWPHCFESIGGFHLLPILSLAAPHIAVLFGFLSIYGFICAITQIILMAVFILTSYLVIIQMQCIFSGQTIHEKRAGITVYDLGWKKNFLQVLGKKWYMAILCPFISSPIPGDGLNFVTFYDLEEVKNV